VNPGRDLRSLQTIFLDRDGVINQKLPEGRYVSRWEEFHLLPGVPAAIARLNRAGYLVLVVSNQRGIALGKYTAEDVGSIHRTLQATLATHHAHIDGFYFCPHDKGQCDCRKPKPGLFLQAQAEFPQIAWSTSLLIGDSLSDVEAGSALAMRTVFVDTGSANQKPGSHEAATLADFVFHSLPEAVDAILSARS
jgi:D-glycero-D-manno-heptose 1,7-bisphosphate phosphatase